MQSGEWQSNSVSRMDVHTLAHIGYITNDMYMTYVQQFIIYFPM